MNSIILPVILFTLSMTITPGPNNMLLTASGAQFGFKRTLPFIGGIVLGIASQLILSAMGMGLLFQRFPWLKLVLKIAGSIYLVYLAVKIAFQPRSSAQKDSDQRPMKFLEGAAFQYLNPKAYVMTITAMAVYPLEGSSYLPSAAFILISFLIICPLSISLWAAFGSILNRWMNQEKFRRTLNYSLGAITALSVVFIVI